MRGGTHMTQNRNKAKKFEQLLIAMVLIFLISPTAVFAKGGKSVGGHSSSKTVSSKSTSVGPKSTSGKTSSSVGSSKPSTNKTNSPKTSEHVQTPSNKTVIKPGVGSNIESSTPSTNKTNSPKTSEQVKEPFTTPITKPWIGTKSEHSSTTGITQSLVDKPNNNPSSWRSYLPFYIWWASTQNSHRQQVENDMQTVDNHKDDQTTVNNNTQTIDNHKDDQTTVENDAQTVESTVQDSQTTEQNKSVEWLDESDRKNAPFLIAAWIGMGVFFIAGFIKEKMKLK